MLLLLLSVLLLDIKRCVGAEFRERAVKTTTLRRCERGDVTIYFPFAVWDPGVI